MPLVIADSELVGIDRHVLEQRVEVVVELGLEVLNLAVRERGGNGVGDHLGELFGRL